MSENDSLTSENMSLRSENVSLRAQNDFLQRENTQLCQRIAELENKVTSLQEPCLSGIAERLEEQTRRLLLNSQLVHHTITDFNSFSIKGIISDVEREAPDLLQLLKISHSSRNVHDDNLAVEEIKSTVSLCTLLNARTNRASVISILDFNYANCTFSKQAGRKVALCV